MFSLEAFFPLEDLLSLEALLSLDALDQLPAGHRTREAFFGADGLLDQLSKEGPEAQTPSTTPLHIRFQRSGILPLASAIRPKFLLAEEPKL